MLLRAHLLCYAQSRTAREKEGGIGCQRQGGIIACPHPTFLLHIHSRSLLPCCVTHLPLQAILSPTAETPSSRTPCTGDRAFLQTTLSVLGLSSTRPSKRIVCCACISRNQIMKMLRLAQYLSHGCLHFEETETIVY